VLTNDGRIFTGVLKSFDQRLNIILADCFENVYSGKEVPVEKEEMGVYFIRGDNISMVG
jgi:U6 snRNA-associated Sm-like protein LSm1